MDCVLRCYAHALDVSHQELMIRVGHNGTEIINPELEFPESCRAFSVFELNRTLYSLDYSVTMFNKYDSSYNHKMRQPKVLNKVDRIAPYLGARRYCLSNKDHMIGVRDGIVLDLRAKPVQKPEDFDYDMIYIVEKIAF